MATSECGNAYSDAANGFRNLTSILKSWSTSETFLFTPSNVEIAGNDFASKSVLCRTLRATHAGRVERD
jgi:hypothetical protein